MSFVDFHVHAGKYELLRDDIQGLLTRFPMEPDVDVTKVFSLPREMEKYLGSRGVTRAIVFAECGPGTNFSIDSELIAKFCAGSDMLVPFGNINPNYHRTVEELEKSLACGVKGFKFYPADHSFDPNIADMMTVYEACEQSRLPVVFHTGLTAQRDTEQQYIRPVEFEEIIRRHPDLPVVLSHMGRPHWYEEALMLARRYPNVYLDSALVDPVELMRVIGEPGPLHDKLLFGSDWPVCGSYTRLLERYGAAGINPELSARMFGGNAAALMASVGIG